MIFLKPEPIGVDDLPAEALEALAVEIRAYIKAGGILTPEMWQRMEPAEKAAYTYIQGGGVEKEYGVLREAIADVKAAKGSAP